MTAYTSDNIQQWFSENAQQAHDHDTSESGRSHSHDHHHSGHHHHHHHDKDNFHDYMQAVADYKKTFSNKEKVIEQTPDPAVRELLLHMQEIARPDDAADAIAVALTHANCQHAKELYRIQ